MAAAEADLAAFLGTLPVLRVETRRMAKTKAVPFSADVQEVIAATAGDLGIPVLRLMSGAGHDAQELAPITPTAMIVVRGQYDGISHNPREYSTPEDCAAGVKVLANTILRLTA
jgi:N-carbamoyl-L-amino-acid hydrolase